MGVSVLTIMSESLRITDWGVCQLARTCNRLRYIDLAGDTLLSDVAVCALAANCPKLKRVGLVKVCLGVVTRVVRARRLIRRSYVLGGSID